MTADFDAAVCLDARLRELLQDCRATDDSREEALGSVDDLAREFEVPPSFVVRELDRLLTQAPAGED